MAGQAPPSRFATEAQLAAWKQAPGGSRAEVDVVVVGGGLSGVAAALAAARRGASVVVLEPTHMLGGQSSAAGVAAADVTFHFAELVNGYGLWGEFVRRITKIYDEEYGIPVNSTRYRDESFGPNPITYDRVFTEMLAEAGVIVWRNAEILEIVRTADRVIVYIDQGWVKGEVCIEASEEGTALELLKVGHRLGNLESQQGRFPDVDLAQVRVQDITWVGVIRRYDEGLPEWARITEMPPGYERRRALIARGYSADPGGQREHPNGFAGYRATADLNSAQGYRGSEWEKVTKTAINFLNDAHIGADYFTSPEARERYQVNAMSLTLSIIYYLQVECGLPWSVADDEGYADGLRSAPVPDELAAFRDLLRHFPPIPYVREARRGIGREVLTAKRIFRFNQYEPAPWDVNAIAVGTYPTDVHGARSQEHLEDHLGEQATDKPLRWREGPFAIPLGALIPANSPRLILAEKNISATRLAAGATRLHPTVVAVGEAAGVVAAMMVRFGVPAEQLPTVAVQANLIRGGVLLASGPIDGLAEDDPRSAAIRLSVCRRLVDVQHRTRQQKADGAGPVVTADLDRAARLGDFLLYDYRDWLLDVAPQTT